MAEVRVTKVMALTVDDLLRLLPALEAGVQFNSEHNRIEVMPG